MRPDNSPYNGRGSILRNSTQPNPIHPNLCNLTNVTGKRGICDALRPDAEPVILRFNWDAQVWSRHSSVTTTDGVLPQICPWNVVVLSDLVDPPAADPTRRTFPLSGWRRWRASRVNCGQTQSWTGLTQLTEFPSMLHSSHFRPVSENYSVKLVS